MFWVFGHKACGILTPRPGIEPTPPALGDEVLTAGLRAVPQITSATKSFCSSTDKAVPPSLGLPPYTDTLLAKCPQIFLSSLVHASESVH